MAGDDDSTSCFSGRRHRDAQGRIAVAGPAGYVVSVIARHFAPGNDLFGGGLGLSQRLAHHSEVGGLPRHPV